MSEISFPLEFNVKGTPVSLQTKNPRAKAEWKQRVKDSVSHLLPEMHFASEAEIAVVIYHFPEGQMQGDIDNIVKPFLDGLTACVFVDDQQVERIVIQKFEPERVAEFASPSKVLLEAVSGDRPTTFIRITDDPVGDRHDYLA